ncbi:armadillo-type protein [Pisolithus tinctorius]|nr:armadillo-type protein [Pisolithus tinctorius]
MTESAPVTVTRHPEFYFENGTFIFWVENTLYKLNHDILVNESKLFADVFSLGQYAPDSQEGKVDGQPIILGGKNLTAQTFDLFVEFKFMCPRPSAKYSLDDLKNLLEFVRHFQCSAHMLNFVTSCVIERAYFFHPSELVYLGIEYKIRAIFERGFTRLCEVPLTKIKKSHHVRMGMDTVMKAQAPSLPFTPVFATLVAIINTKLPQVGELVLAWLISQFRCAFKRNDKTVCHSSTTFIAHLINQAVAHEIIALETLIFLLECPTDDSVEIAVGFMREVGAFLAENSPKANALIFKEQEGKLDRTGTNLVNLRQMIYLTIMNALNYEEAVHKLLKIQSKEGGEIELINMIIACKSTLTPPSTALLGNDLVSLIASGWSVLNKHSTTTTIPFTDTRHPDDVPNAHLPHGETTAKVTVRAQLGAQTARMTTGHMDATGNTLGNLVATTCETSTAKTRTPRHLPLVGLPHFVDLTLHLVDLP